MAKSSIAKTQPSFLSYLHSRLPVVIAGSYFFIGVILRAYTSLNILPHCLWRTLFHHPCPGCGLTTAFTHLLRFDFAGACTANPLIYPITLLAIVGVGLDLWHFFRT